MEWWVAASWGLVGAGAVEALALYKAIHRVKEFPWRVKGEVHFHAYLASVVIRITLGAGLAAAFGASGQIAGPLGAVIVGIAAPKIVEQLLRQGVPRHVAEPSAVTEQHTSAPMEGAPDAA